MAYRRHLNDEKKRKKLFYTNQNSINKAVEFDDISSTYTISPKSSTIKEVCDEESSDMLKGRPIQNNSGKLVKQTSGSTAIDDK